MQPHFTDVKTKVQKEVIKSGELTKELKSQLQASGLFEFTHLPLSRALNIAGCQEIFNKQMKQGPNVCIHLTK